MPGLFSTKVSTWRLSGLQRALNEYQEVPLDSDPHVVAAMLVLGLRMLPEPLLTYQSYHSFLSCARLPDEKARQGVMRGLINGLPLEHKPTLRGLMGLLHKACYGIGMLDSGDVAQTFHQGVIRSYVPEVQLPVDPPETVAVVKAMIDDYDLLFADVKEADNKARGALQRKVAKLSTVVEATRLRADESDPRCLALFEELFRFLARVERRRESLWTLQSPDLETPVVDEFGCRVRSCSVDMAASDPKAATPVAGG